MTTAIAKTKIRKHSYWSWLDQCRKQMRLAGFFLTDWSIDYWRPLFSSGLSPEAAISQYWKDKVRP